MYYVGAFNYSQVKNALVADATTANDLSSIATLPATDPTNGGTFYVASAEAKALGLWAGTIPDGWIGLSSGAGWDYNNADGVSAGTYDFYGTVLHEITEVLGRETTDGSSGEYNPLDLFHYSAPGVRTFSGTTPGYFSVDNGQTNLNNFNTNPGGDFGDWAGNTADAANAYGTPGVVSPFSAADLAALDVIGWNRVSSSAPGVPTISSVSPDTGVAGDGITNASTLTLTGTAVASSTVNVYDGATLLGTATANASGAWTFTSGTLSNGSPQLHRDRYGFGCDQRRVRSPERDRRYGRAGCAHHCHILHRQRHGRRPHHQRQHADLDRHGGSQQRRQGLRRRHAAQQRHRRRHRRLELHHDGAEQRRPQPHRHRHRCGR